MSAKSPQEVAVRAWLHEASAKRPMPNTTQVFKRARLHRHLRLIRALGVTIRTGGAA